MVPSRWPLPSPKKLILVAGSLERIFGEGQHEKQGGERPLGAAPPPPLLPVGQGLQIARVPSGRHELP